MGRILFVHGMGHDPRRDYWRDWAATLQKELCAQGAAVSPGDFAGVYYYDLVPHPARRPEMAEGRQRFLSAVRAEAQGELAAEYTGVHSSTRVPLGRLVDFLVDNFGDIYAYLYVDTVCQAVNWRVYQAILTAGGPVHLLGYSLGALVCYCALQASPPLAARVAHLVMLGNPLYWFRREVARRADYSLRPAVGYWTNVAGLVDIAWPHAVPRVVRGLDEHLEFVVDRINPIRGHHAYFTHPESIRIIAGALKKRL
ncbi:MAG TPA: hypothetical protein GXX25_00865 [Desulfotomaculum sp.]|nr:hypothetical protein [Desulfotomaculum sp.]